MCYVSASAKARTFIIRIFIRDHFFLPHTELLLPIPFFIISSAHTQKHTRTRTRTRQAKTKNSVLRERKIISDGTEYLMKAVFPFKLILGHFFLGRPPIFLYALQNANQPQIKCQFNSSAGPVCLCAARMRDRNAKQSILDIEKFFAFKFLSILSRCRKN